jgi:hypothetical protein
VGQRILDFGTPGERYKEGDPQETGIFARPMQSWITKRQKQFEDHSAGNRGAQDGTPFRYIEITYPLTAQEKEVADLYYKARQAGLWRVDYFWNKGNQEKKPNLLCYPNGNDGSEHCISLATGIKTQVHKWAIEHALYHDLGVKEDLQSWFGRPEVQEFQNQARTLLAKQPYDDNDPKTWDKIDHTFLAKTDLFKTLESVVPKNLSEEQKSQLMDFVLGYRLIHDYQKLTAKLGIREDNFLDYGNPNVGAVTIYDGPASTDSFTHANYDYRGAVFGFHNDGKNRPLPRAP